VNEPFAPFSVPMTVRGYELDTQGHLNQAVYLQYAEHARWELLRAAGIEQNRMVSSGVGPVVLETTIRYRSELRGGDEVTVSCALSYQQGRKVFRMHQEVRRLDGTLSAEIEVVGGILDLHSRRLVADPRACLAELATRPELLDTAGPRPTDEPEESAMSRSE
jgi:acyl-CoA thioester hydrolase